VTNDEVNKYSTKIDRMISTVAPGWGFKRMAARAQIDAMTRFAPLQNQRDIKTFGDGQGDLDERLPWRDRLKMINMFDTLVHENPLLSGMVDQYICNVIPATGIRPIPTTGDTDFNKACAEAFEAWAEKGEARGMSFWQFQRPYLKSVIGHGDAGAAKVRDDGPRIQGIPANRIATPLKYNIYEDGKVRQGVYTGRGVRPKGYYVVRRDKYMYQIRNEHRYVSADKMLFSYDPAKYDLENYRGVSNFLTCFPQIQRFDSLLKYKTFQEKMAAVFGIAIKKDKEKESSPVRNIGSSRETQSEQKTGATRPDIELFSGMGITLNNDEDISTIEHKSQGNDFKDFLWTVAQIIGVGANLPIEFVLLDWSRANYYGNKMSTTMAKRKFANSYQIVVQLVEWVYKWVINQKIANGELKPPAGLKGDPLAMTCTMPPPLELDENKAFDLHRKKVENNVATWEDYARSQGRNVDDIFELRKQELKKQKDKKLPIPATSEPGVKLLSQLDKEQKQE